MRRLAHYCINKLAYFAAIVLVSSCNTFYNTAGPYVPAFTETKSLNADVSLGGMGVNAAVSYSPVNYVYFGGQMHSMSASNQSHVSGGLHLGYFSNGDSIDNFHTNVQLGCNFGNSHYGDRNDTLFPSGIADYMSFYGQVFIGGDFGYDKPYFLGAGIMFNSVIFDYRLMKYTSREPGPFDTKAGLGCIFIVYQRKLISNPNLRFTICGGYQRALPMIEGPGYNYSSLLIRFGVCYQFHLK